MMFLRRAHRGQVTVEYAVIFGMVIAALIALALYLRRGVQGGIKGNADSFGTQFSSADPWESHSRSASVETTAQVASSQISNNCQGVGGGALDAAGDQPCDPGTVEAAATELFTDLCARGVAGACTAAP